MDDQTEVPQGLFRVQYLEQGRTIARVTGEMPYDEAMKTSQDLGRSGEVTSSRIIPAEEYVPLEIATANAEFTGTHDVEDEIADGVTAAAVPLDGFPQEPTDAEFSEFEKGILSDGMVGRKWAEERNRHAALDFALRWSSSFRGGGMVVASGPSADDTVKAAKTFLDFLNGDRPEG